MNSFAIHFQHLNLVTERDFGDQRTEILGVMMNSWNLSWYFGLSPKKLENSSKNVNISYKSPPVQHTGHVLGEEDSGHGLSPPSHRLRTSWFSQL